MKPLCARDALSDAIIDVSAELRPIDVHPQVVAKQATHAIVFDEGQFRGVVGFQQIDFSKSGRIFLDLIPPQPTSAVLEDALIGDVGPLIGTGASEVLVVTAPDGGFRGIVTQQSLLRALLRRSEIHSAKEQKAAAQKFQGLLDSAPDAMLVVDGQGRIVQANTQTAAMFGFELTELLSLPIERLLPARFGERHVEHLRHFFENPSRRPMGRGMELSGVRRDGEEFPIEISITPLEGDRQPLAIAAIRDIADRKKVEESVRRARDFYLTLLNDFPLPIWRSGPDAKCNYFNRTWLAFTGRALEQELGDGWAQGVHPDDVKLCLERYLDAFHARESFTLEYRLRRHDGEFRWLIDWGCPISELDGSFAGYIGAVQDITEPKSIGVALKESNRQLEAAMRELTQTQQQVVRQERMRAVGEMASGIAHDLNNSLSPVLGYAEMVAASPEFPERLRELVQMIQTSALDAAAVVQRLSDFYRTDGPGFAVAIIKLSELVRQIPALTRPKWRDEAQKTSRTIEFKVEVEDNVVVIGNPSELREVLVNLIFNAVDAIPVTGTITLRLRVEDETAVVEVDDTGIGMTEDAASRCFEPFFSTKGPLGNGLGLSVCHGIVERHRGRFEVETRLGVGTTMRFVLPLANDMGAQSTGQPTGRAFFPPRRKLLYIDDDPRLRGLVAVLLGELGQEVDVATGGAEGLSMFRVNQYDAIITDWGMPGIDGREVTRIIKQLRPGFPVIMVTGWGAGSPPDPSKIDIVPDKIVSKPITREKLHQALESLST